MRILLVFIILLYTLISSSQTLEVIYERGPTKLPDKIVKEAPSFNEKKFHVRASLIISKGISVFKRDSVFVEYMPLSTRHAFINQTCYKNYNKSKIIVFRSDYEDDLAMEMSFAEAIESLGDVGQWEIDENQTKVICGLKCHKAVINGIHTKVVAWYCPEIPYPHGPGSECINLPGLILEYERLDDRWVAKEVNYIKGSSLINIPEYKIAKSNGLHKLNYEELNTYKGFSRLIQLDDKTQTNKWIRIENWLKK